MSLDEMKKAQLNADMIVAGYAFSRLEDANIRVMELHAPFHALVMSQKGEVLETSMNDVELDIVRDFWTRNQKCMEEVHA